MSENYQIGELVRADVVIRGKVERVLLTYIPDYPGDEVPWRRLVPNGVGGWHTTEDLANIERMVAVPVISREQLFSVVACEAWSGNAEIVDAVLALFEQGKV